MNDFSVKNFMIENNLADKDGNFIVSAGISNPEWSIGYYDHWTAMLYFGTLIHFLYEKFELDNLNFAIRMNENGDYSLDMKEIDRKLGGDDWGLIIEVLDYLVPLMAGSNVTYLGGGVFFEG